MRALQKIDKYLERRGKPTTIKQIQSRLKTQGTTCDDIFHLLQTSSRVRVTYSERGVSCYETSVIKKIKMRG